MSAHTISAASQDRPVPSDLCPPNSNRASCPAAVHDTSFLGNDHFALGNESARRLSSGLHELAPCSRFNGASSLAWADGPARARLEQAEDLPLEHSIGVAESLRSAPRAAVRHLVPVSRPLAAPRDRPSAFRAALHGGSVHLCPAPTGLVARRSLRSGCGTGASRPRCWYSSSAVRYRSNRTRFRTHRGLQRGAVSASRPDRLDA